MVDAAELARLLVGTVLGGREVAVAGAPTLAVRCEPEEVWSAWQAARSVVDRSGRWPVLVASFGGTEPWEFGLGIDPAEAHAHAVVAAARHCDPWATFDRALDDTSVGEDDLRTMFAEAPPHQIDPDLWLTHRENVWFTPTGLPCAVAFVAAGTSWEAGARLSYYGVDHDTDRQVAMVAVEQEWSRRYGAELVASWGTMRQYVVACRPSTVEQAWELAGQHLAVGGSLQARQSELALALLHTDYWFLHDRP